MRTSWALVPVKSWGSAKRRLEPCLGDQRSNFSVAMLKDVLNALIESREIGNIAVVTADSEVKTLVEELGMLVITENGSRGLNSAIGQGIDGIRKLGGVQIAITHADIPLATGAEIDRICGSVLRSRMQSAKARSVSAPVLIARVPIFFVLMPQVQSRFTMARTVTGNTRRQPENQPHRP